MVFLELIPEVDLFLEVLWIPLHMRKGRVLRELQIMFSYRLFLSLNKDIKN